VIPVKGDDAVDISKLLEKAREAAERRNYDYAIELYLQACKLDMDNPVARRELRAVENRMAKEKGATFWGKTKVAGLHAQAQMMFKMKKYDGVIEKAEDALRIDPGNVGVLMLLGKAALAAGHRKTAICTFEDVKAMNTGKVSIDACRELAQAYEEEGRIKDAQDIWLHVAKLVPNDRDAMVKIRDLSARTMSNTIEAAAVSGQRGSAARSTQTDQQKKDAAKLDREKSSDIKTADDLKLAIQDAKEELQKRPDDPRPHATLGDLYKHGGDYNESKKAYEAARQKDPNNPTYLFKLHDLEIWKMLGALKAQEPQVKAGAAGAKEQYEKGRLALLEYRLTSFIEREKQYSTDSKVKFDLACIYFELAPKKDKALYDESIKRFQITFRDPKFRVESGLRMGLGFAAKGQHDLALKRFDETLAGMEIKNDHWKNLHYYKADTLEKAGRPADSLKTFLEIYEVDVSFRDVGKRVESLQQKTGSQGAVS
jgi:tetratricopeptide (TPR) repeat protein